MPPPFPWPRVTDDERRARIKAAVDEAMAQADRDIAECSSGPTTFVTKDRFTVQEPRGPSRLRRFVRILRGRWRLWWGLCPACNSDAPAIDKCKVCGGYRSNIDGHPPRHAVKTMWWQRFTALFVLAAILSLGGCSTTPQPNAPSGVTATHTESHKASDGSTVTVTESFAHHGPENESRTAPVSWSNKGLRIGSAEAVPADMEAAMGEPLFVIGGIVMAIGVGLLVLSKFPGVTFVVPPGVGLWTIAGGAAIAITPFVGEGIRDAVPALAVIGALVAVIYYGQKAGWFKWMTRPEAQLNMVAEGQPDAAGAMAFLHTGGDRDKAKKAKAVAKAVVAAPAGGKP